MKEKYEECKKELFFSWYFNEIVVIISTYNTRLNKIFLGIEFDFLIKIEKLLFMGTPV